ncbi:MAG: hypothetical protein M1133_11030 [Armatimonadetes bacterium]|nr:hypothetical protein [Armatimonadota bacterium]
MYCLNSEVTCTVSSATDEDSRYNPNGNPQWTYPSDTFNNSDAYDWSATYGSWKNGVHTGQSVTWIAPATPGSYTIYCTIKDDAVIPQGETGNRNDDPDVQKSVTVYVVDLSYVAISQVNGVEYDLPGGFGGSKVYVPTSGSAPTLQFYAKITPAIAGVTVNWSFTDPDEPSGHVPDDTDSNGNDNNGSNAGFASSSSTTNSSGEATVTFTATNYGGDNFKLKATLCSTTKETQEFTIWKKIAFEEEDAISGYSSSPSNIDAELTKTYVERVVTASTGDTIPTNDQYLTDSGAYGPSNDSDRASLAQEYDDDPTTDEQLITVRAESSGLNYIGNANKEPYSSGTSYTFGTAASGAIDWNNQGDMAPAENGNTGFHFGGSAPWVLVYNDAISADALVLGVTVSNRLKRTVWHEVGHALGVTHGYGDGVYSIMNQMPWYNSQTSVDSGRSLVVNMHWADAEGTRVRQSYVPNAQ